ncbi:MAG: transposase, partial [Acidimicrobiales bacterium]
QRNFTDEDARMMKTNEGFQYAYNAQAVVDEKSQVIIAAEITQQAGDVGQLLPMVTAASKSLLAIGIESSPKVILADAGYCSEDNLASLEKDKVNALIATGRLTSILGTRYCDNRLEVSAGREAEAEAPAAPPGNGDVELGEAGVDQHGGVGA